MYLIKNSEMFTLSILKKKLPFWKYLCLDSNVNNRTGNSCISNTRKMLSVMQKKKKRFFFPKNKAKLIVKEGEKF